MSNTVASVWDGMSESDFQIIQSWIRECANRLGLRDWVVRLERQPCKEGKAATVHVLGVRKFACIFLSYTWATDDEKRATIAHELLHCHFHVAQEIVYSAEEILGKAVSSVLFENYRQAIEIAIDGISVEIVNVLPEYPLGDR